MTKYVPTIEYMPAERKNGRRAGPRRKFDFFEKGVPQRVHRDQHGFYYVVPAVLSEANLYESLTKPMKPAARKGCQTGAKRKARGAKASEADSDERATYPALTDVGIGGSRRGTSFGKEKDVGSAHNIYLMNHGGRKGRREDEEG